MKRAHCCGINTVKELLEARPEQVTRLWLSGEHGRLARLADRARALGIALEIAAAPALDRRAGGARHQGVVAEFRPRPALGDAELDTLLENAGGNTLLLILDQVQDPHNLGACLRSAAAAGATAVIVPRDRAAGLTPAARKAAAGATEWVALIESANLARLIERLKRLGVWCIGLAGETETALWQTDLTVPVALVLGGEQHGLRRLTRERCDGLAGIPMTAPAESLNVSVAAGIALFEAVRQRGAGAQRNPAP